MLNEGMIANSAAALVKSEMVKQIRELGPCSPDEFERAVFKALTGRNREEVDWDLDDNQAGFYTWLKSFDQLIDELVEDGFMRVKETRILMPTEADPQIEFSHLAYPKARTS
jgi:hypothetical protein